MLVVPGFRSNPVLHCRCNYHRNWGYWFTNVSPRPTPLKCGQPFPHLTPLSPSSFRQWFSGFTPGNWRKF